MFVPNSFVDGSAGNTPITAATLNNLENGLVAADITNPASAAAVALGAAYQAQTTALSPRTRYTTTRPTWISTFQAGHGWVVENATANDDTTLYALG